MLGEECPQVLFHDVGSCHSVQQWRQERPIQLDREKEMREREREVTNLTPPLTSNREQSLATHPLPQSPVLQLKPAGEDRVARLRVGQEVGVVEETADRAVWVGGGNGRSSSLGVWVKGHVFISISIRENVNNRYGMTPSPTSVQ